MKHRCHYCATTHESLKKYHEHLTDKHPTVAFQMRAYLTGWSARLGWTAAET